MRDETSLLNLAKVYKGPLFSAYVALVTLMLFVGPQFPSIGKAGGADAKTAAAKQPAVVKGAEGSTVIAFAPYPMMFHPIRIGLQTRAPNVRISVWSQGAVFIDNRPVFALKPQMVYNVTPGQITELATGHSFPLPSDRRATVSSSDYRVWANNKWWRGAIELISFPNGITAVNTLDLEDYLLGVVPSEMPSSWHIEALKCQAVAARSYAWAHMGAGSKWKSEGFDLVPDVRDQAYKGMQAEARSTYFACFMTRGLILKNADKVKAGFYRAWVGDDMENLNIRMTRIPQAALEKLTGVKNIVGVTVMHTNAQGNADNIVIMGAKKSLPVHGIWLAQQLKLTTAGILDVHQQGDDWVFTYRGPGNGARGMSQHGADMLAKRGWTFDQILLQYYQDNDGKLRLGYIDNYIPMMPAMAGKPQPKKPQLTFSKGSIVETDTDASAKSKAEAEKENDSSTSTNGKKKEE